MNVKKMAGVAVSVMLLAMGSAALAAPITIDSFTDEFPSENIIYGYAGTTIFQVGPISALEVGDYYFAVTPTNDELGEPLPAVTRRNVDSITQTSLAGVLGGQRTGTLTSTGTLGKQSRAEIGEGFLAASSGSFAKQTLVLEYGNASPLNANFSTLVGGYFLINDWYLDHGTVTATLSVTSGTTTQNKSITLNPDPYESPVDYAFAFSDFNLVDFSDVDIIRLECVSTATAQDYMMANFQVIPEPATMSLLALGGLAVIRRRRMA